MRKAQEFLSLFGVALALCCANICADESSDVDKWIEQLASEDFDIRETAAAELGKRAEKIWDRLEKLTRSENIDVRTLTRRAMCEAGRRALVPMIEAAKAKVKASEESIKERESAVHSAVKKFDAEEIAAEKAFFSEREKHGNNDKITDVEKAAEKAREEAIQRARNVKDAFDKECTQWRIDHAKNVSRLDQLRQLQASSELILPADAPKWGPDKLPFKQRLQVNVSFEFVDTSLKDALALLSEMSAIPIKPGAKIKAEDLSIPITLRVTDMSAELSLSWICKLAELAFEADYDKESLRITPPADVAKPKE